MQQTGASQYGGSTEMSNFSGNGGRQRPLIQPQNSAEAVLAEAASPISVRPPAISRSIINYEGLVGGFTDDDGLGGEESERGIGGGNRWPRQETLALLQIRFDMDAAFREASLKGPLWGDVSRKLAELGYTRSAKKCKEKFENVQKYYKRTKDGRAGRQDGKSYRFFSQLEAINTSTNPNNIGSNNITAGQNNSGFIVNNSMNVTKIQAAPISAVAPPTQINTSTVAAITGGGISLSSSTASFSSSDSGEETGGENVATNMDSRKRKRSSTKGSGSRKMMELFEGLMKQVMQKQEMMQQKFLEAIEKREQDRLIRDEAWKRQEMVRLNREHDNMAQERAMAAARDNAVLSFLQKITGQTIQIPPLSTVKTPSQSPQTAQSQPLSHPQISPASQLSHRHQQNHPPRQYPPLPNLEHNRDQQSPATESTPLQDHGEVVVSFDSTSSRWPKGEVLALIELRSGLESKYQEAGPKGPLWEDISAGMQRMGFNRSAKRCKEKWENINKYFKKVKESNKKRPEDAKTCPYFHQLDALYRKKYLCGVGSSSFGNLNKTNQLDSNAGTKRDALAIMPLPQPLSQKDESENKRMCITTNTITTPNNININRNGGNGVDSNGSLPSSFFQGGTTKKPEEIMKSQLQEAEMDEYDKLDEQDSENLDQEDDDDDDDGKTDYKIQFQRKSSNSNHGGNPPTTTTFMTMV